MNSRLRAESLTSATCLVQSCSNVEVSFLIDAHAVAAATRIKIDQCAAIVRAPIRFQVIDIDPTVTFRIRMSLDEVQATSIRRNNNTVWHVHGRFFQELMEAAVRIDAVNRFAIFAFRVLHCGSGCEVDPPKNIHAEIVRHRKLFASVLVGKDVELSGCRICPGNPAGSSFTCQQRTVWRKIQTIAL